MSNASEQLKTKSLFSKVLLHHFCQMMNVGHGIVATSIEIEYLAAQGKNQKNQFIIYMLNRLEKHYFLIMQFIFFLESFIKQTNKICQRSKIIMERGL